MKFQFGARFRSLYLERKNWDITIIETKPFGQVSLLFQILITRENYQFSLFYVNIVSLKKVNLIVTFFKITEESVVKTEENAMKTDKLFRGSFKSNQKSFPQNFEFFKKFYVDG